MIRDPDMDPLDWKTHAYIKARLYWAQFRAWMIAAFEIEERGTSIEIEVFSGCVHFISCLFVLPVIPTQMSAAGYDKSSSIEATALGCAFGCLLSSYIINLPFVIAPLTSVSIYLAVALQQQGMTHMQGDAAVILSGCALLFIGVVRPLLALISHLIPNCIQASTAAGIGLITALAGAIELELVVQGKYTIVEMGPITPAIVIATVATIITALTMHYNYKGAYVYGLAFGTFTWWWAENAWPSAVGGPPHFELDREVQVDNRVVTLLFNLIFLYILTLNGIARSMSDLAYLTNSDNSIPRGNWLFIVCGLATILSGYFSGPPILISPESACGIKVGARTGLSTVVCGLLFALSMFFCPIFSAVPPAGTSPLLILVGLTLFMNASRVNWSNVPEAVPAFFVLLLIPFTYSILCGVGFGYVVFIGIGLFSGNLLHKSRAVGMRLFEHGITYQNILTTFRSGKYAKADEMSASNSSDEREDKRGGGGGGGGGGGAEEREEGQLGGGEGGSRATRMGHSCESGDSLPDTNVGGATYLFERVNSVPASRNSTRTMPTSTSPRHTHDDYDGQEGDVEIALNPIVSLSPASRSPADSSTAAHRSALSQPSLRNSRSTVETRPTELLERRTSFTGGHASALSPPTSHPSQIASFPLVSPSATTGVASSATTAGSSLLPAAAVRGRSGSILDALSMDLTTGIHSMQA